MARKTPPKRIVFEARDMPKSQIDHWVLQENCQALRSRQSHLLWMHPHHRRKFLKCQRCGWGQRWTFMKRISWCFCESDFCVRWFAIVFFCFDACVCVCRNKTKFPFHVPFFSQYNLCTTDWTIMDYIWLYIYIYDTYRGFQMCLEPLEMSRCLHFPPLRPGSGAIPWSLCWNWGLGAVSWCTMRVLFHELAVADDYFGQISYFKGKMVY